MFVSRKTLQALAEGKLDDALLLLRNNRCSNAYYLAGYALELGFKAAACKLSSRVSSRPESGRKPLFEWPRP